MARRGGGLQLVISGDASGALAAIGAVDAGSGRLGGSFAAVGKAAVAGFAAVAAAAAAAAVGLYKIGDEFDQAYDKIRIGTGATGEALEGLKDSFRTVAADVPSSFEDVSTAIADINTRLGITGPELETVSGQMLNLSRITDTDLSSNIDTATRLFGDFGVSAAEMPETLDKVYRASQASGIGLEQLMSQVVDAGAPFRSLGFSIDDSLAMFAKWNKEGVNTEKIVAGLRIGIGQWAEEGIDPAEGFRQAVEGISSGTMDLNDAIEIFGSRNANDIFAAIREGRFDIEGMSDAIVNGADTINQASADTEDAGEKFQRFKNRVMLALEPLAGRVFDAAGQAMDALGPVLTDVAAEAGPVIERLSAWLGEKMPEAMAWLQTKAEELWPVLQEFFGEVSRIVEENWPEIEATVRDVMSGVMEVVDNVAATVIDLWNRFGDDILAGASERFGALIQQFRGIFNVIAGIVNTVMAVIRGDWSGAWEGIKQTLGGVVDFFVGWGRYVWSIFGGIIRAIGEVVGQTWFSIWHGVRDFFVGIWNGIVGLAQGYFRWLWDLASGFGETLWGIWSGLWNGIVTFTRNALGLVVGVARSQIDGIKRAFELGVAAIGRVWGGLKTIFSSVANWVIDNVINRFIGAVNRVADAIGVNLNLPTLGNVGGGSNPSGGGSANYGGAQYHSGGIVPGVGEQPATLLGGEGVLPVDVMRRMGSKQFELLRQGKTDAIGDGLGLGTISNALSEAASWVAERVRDVVANVARPAVMWALDRLDGVAPGVPGRMFAGAARMVGDKVLDWIDGAGREAEKYAVPTLSPGVGWQAMWDVVSKQFPWARLHSGLRPGAITATGNKSYHSMGRAIDITPSMEIFDWLRDSYKHLTAELIFSPAGGRQVHNRRDHFYTGVTRANHWDHIHWAADDGAAWSTSGRPTRMIIDSKVPEDFLAVPHRYGGIGGLGGPREVHVHLEGAVVSDGPEGVLRLIEEAAKTGKGLGPASRRLLGVA